VGVAALNNGVAYAAYMHHPQSGPANLQFFRIAEGVVHPYPLWNGAYGGDCEWTMRVRSDGRKVILAVRAEGTCLAVYNAEPGNDPIAALDKSKSCHTDPTGRDQDIYAHPDGSFELIIGASRSAYYNRYDASGKKVHAKDIKALPNLGTWKKGTGNAAIAATADKKYVLAAGVAPEGGDFPVTGRLVYALSSDGGTRFGEQKQVGNEVATHRGTRANLVVQCHKGVFHLFYSDTKNAKLATFSVPAALDAREARLSGLPFRDPAGVVSSGQTAPCYDLRGRMVRRNLRPAALRSMGTGAVLVAVMGTERIARRVIAALE
jgi:hypothetical protein